MTEPSFFTAYNCEDIPRHRRAQGSANRDAEKLVKKAAKQRITR